MRSGHETPSTALNPPSLPQFSNKRAPVLAQGQGRQTYIVYAHRIYVVFEIPSYPYSYSYYHYYTVSSARRRGQQGEWRREQRARFIGGVAAHALTHAGTAPLAEPKQRPRRPGRGALLNRRCCRCASSGRVRSVHD